jgi:glycosyltransferase involved in cell wall biosynthesis
VDQAIYFFIDHTATYEYNTGIQRVTRSLARELQSLGRDIVYVRWSDDQRSVEYSSEEEIRLFARWNGPVPQGQSVRKSNGHGDSSPELRGKWLVVPEVPIFGERAKCVTYPLIHYARRHGMKIAFIFYDMIPTVLEGYDWIRNRVRCYMEDLKLADVILPISQYSAQALTSFLQTEAGIDDVQSVRVVPCPLAEEVSGYERVPPQRESLDKTVQILCVGTVEPRKNQLKLIEAFNLLHADGATCNARLALVGKNAGHAGELARAAARGNPHVEFLDYQSEQELAARYMASDFTVYPSIEEGYGLPIAESLWFGKPCLCANFGAMAEVAAGGGCCTVDVRSPEQLRRALSRMITDKELRQNLAEQIERRRFRLWRDYTRDVLCALESRDAASEDRDWELAVLRARVEREEALRQAAEEKLLALRHRIADSAYVYAKNSAVLRFVRPVVEQLVNAARRGLREA